MLRELRSANMIRLAISYFVKGQCVYQRFGTFATVDVFTAD